MTFPKIVNPPATYHLYFLNCFANFALHRYRDLFTNKFLVTVESNAIT